MLKIILFTIFLLNHISAKPITPDQLQFYLNMSGEGEDRRIHKTYLRSIEMSWQIHTPYHRHLFIAAGMDCLNTIKNFDKKKKSDSRGKPIQAAYTPSDMELKAARSLQSAELVVKSLEQKEIDYIFKRFPYYEYEWLQKNNPYRVFPINSVQNFLTLIVSGLFFNDLIPERLILPKLIEAKMFSKWKSPKASTAEIDAYKSANFSELMHMIHVVFHELLPFLEKWGVLVEKSDDQYEAIAFKKVIRDNSLKSVMVLAQAMPEILFRAFGKQMPKWIYNISQSFYITQLGRMALGSQGLAATLAASSMQIFKVSIEKSHRIALDSASNQLEAKIKESLLEWRKTGIPQITSGAKLAGLKLAFKAIAIGSLTWVVIDFAIKTGSALVHGQNQAEANIAGQKYKFSSRQQRMQTSNDKGFDKYRSRAYAFEDALADYQENLLSNVTGVVVSVGTFTVGSPLVLGAAAAAGLPTAGVGGAVVAASGYVMVGTAAAFASHSASNAVRPLQKNFNQIINSGEIETKLRIISSQLKQPLDRQTFEERATDMKNHYKNGHPLRFMSYSNNPAEIKITKHPKGLWIFEQMHSNGNFMRSVNTNVINALNPNSSTIIEAHVRYDFLDRKGDHWAWDEYSNQITKLGLMRLNHNNIEFIGKPGFKINFENNLLKANRSDSDLRVLSNGILMVKDARTNEWMIRGNVANTDIYLRSEKPGRYVWNKTKGGFVKVLTGGELKAASAPKTAQQRSQMRMGSSNGQSLTSDTKGEFFEGIED